MALAGLDPIELPVHRLLNIAQSLWLEEYDPERRAELRLLLAWPEDREEHDRKTAEAERQAAVAEQDSSVRGSAAVIGVNVDKMYERGLKARAAGLAELERRRLAAEQLAVEA